MSCFTAAVFLLWTASSAGFAIHASSVSTAITESSSIDTFLSSTSSSSPPLSWDELSIAVKNKQAESSSPTPPPPRVLLYRDTNGWCPFCERVWVALRAKSIPYEEELINLQNKPDWYKRMVPSALVPAVLFYGNDEKLKPERKLVWESLDILQALDDEFPNSPKLVWDTPEYKEAMEAVDALSRAGIAVSFGARNETLPQEDKEKNRLAFMKELDKLDSALAQSKGPFRLGPELSGVDCAMIPMLERWRYQLPISAALDILDNRPNLQKWFDTMDSFAPYADRVAGDRYSWTATNAMFLRYFASDPSKPEVAQRIQKSENIARELTKSFAEEATVDEIFALEAANKLISNHEAVIRDCTNPDPQSQKEVPRASDGEIADLVLRFVALIMLAPVPSEAARKLPLVEIPSGNHAEASRVAHTVAARLCVPRDMGAPAAKLFRKVLSIVANRFDENP